MYVSRGSCLKCLSPLGKSSASLGRGSVGWEALGDHWKAWCPACHTGAAQ